MSSVIRGIWNLGVFVVMSMAAAMVVAIYVGVVAPARFTLCAARAIAKR